MELSFNATEEIFRNQIPYLDIILEKNREFLDFVYKYIKGQKNAIYNDRKIRNRDELIKIIRS